MNDNETLHIDGDEGMPAWDKVKLCILMRMKNDKQMKH